MMVCSPLTYRKFDVHPVHHIIAMYWVDCRIVWTQQNAKDIILRPRLHSQRICVAGLSEIILGILQTTGIFEEKLDSFFQESPNRIIFLH